ncbi:unnamed protein product [Trifolium pratense]|uniref:Uncharacterized protein n=1 Tax=Trifolium pratense TaxID=57577 RepID=A0ACB0LKL0_TRIPR|nr:unnamed protein product [Trifolium pratense]
MACETKTWLVLHLLLLVTCYMQHCVHGQSSQVPCIFIFGDGLSGNGNNNMLPTTAKANYNPYGIDFPTGPTGRATNGRTAIDIIGELLGFADFIPPFANTSGSNITKGVNYASGSAGIREETGKHMGANVAFGLQIENHKIIVSRLAANLGGLPQARNYLNKCLYYVNIGSSDYINNYYMPQFYTTSRIYSPEQYAKTLVNQISLYIQTLHDVGARKLVLVGLGRIGCTPKVIAANGNGLCDENKNADALIFSHKLKSLVDKFNTLHLDSKSIFLNRTARAVLDRSLGFTVFNNSCCPMNSNGMCIPNSIPCMNRKEYVFYDGVHVTSTVNNLTASTAYDSASNPETTYPMDIKHLAQYTFT